MNTDYKHKPKMPFIGFSTTIRPDEGYVKCPEIRPPLADDEARDGDREVHP